MKTLSFIIGWLAIGWLVGFIKTKTWNWCVYQNNGDFDKASLLQFCLLAIVFPWQFLVCAAEAAHGRGHQLQAIAIVPFISIKTAQEKGSIVRSFVRSRYSKSLFELMNYLWYMVLGGLALFHWVISLWALVCWLAPLAVRGLLRLLYVVTIETRILVRFYKGNYNLS